MTRKYEQTRRREQREETRRRIVDAAIGLHTTVGPARTTVKAIAESAGVERLTVYRHFPDDEAILEACVHDGWARFPPPDPAAWVRVADPETRLRVALGELYAYYGGVGDAFLTIVRDFPRVPYLAELNAPYFAEWRRMRDILAGGWQRRGRRRRLFLAALEHALDLVTWESLVRGRGLGDEEAVELLVRLVRAT